MRLRDRVANRKHKTAVTKESMAKQMESAKAKRYGSFLRIINRLVENLDDYEDVYYHTSEEIFNEIEKRKIDISDIILNADYALFKQQILNDNVSCPCVGNTLESQGQRKTSNEECVKYLREHPDMRF